MSKIEWTDETWNPVVGCSKISAACKNCYAEKIAARMAFNPKAPEEYMDVVLPSGKGWGWNGKTALVESVLLKPMSWRKPRRVFVGSMTDLFHHDTPVEWLDKIFAVMALTPHITYQLLTKRADFMSAYLKALYNPGYDLTPARKALELGTADGLEIVAALKAGPLPNVQVGVTVENQEMTDQRIPYLLDAPAAVRFVSIEPMLGQVDLENFITTSAIHQDDIGLHNRRGPVAVVNGVPGRCPWMDGLDWVICGGETGTAARPMHPEWVRDLRNQCTAAGTPFFFKQWGEWKETHALKCNEPGIKGRKWHNFDPDTSVCRIGKKAAGRELDGRTWEETPEAANA